MSAICTDNILFGESTYVGCSNNHTFHTECIDSGLKDRLHQFDQIILLEVLGLVPLYMSPTLIQDYGGTMQPKSSEPF